MLDLVVPLPHPNSDRQFRLLLLLLVQEVLAQVEELLGGLLQVPVLLPGLPEQCMSAGLLVDLTDPGLELWPLPVEGSSHGHLLLLAGWQPGQGAGSRPT